MLESGPVFFWLPTARNHHNLPGRNSSGVNGELRAVMVRTISASKLHCKFNEFWTSVAVSCKASWAQVGRKGVRYIAVAGYRSCMK